MTGDDGVATLWTAFTVLVLLAVMAVGLDLGAAVVARHRTEAAADLGALAAAGAAADSEAAACARARGVAEGMGTDLTRCALVGWDAFVEVGSRRRLSVVGAGTVVARAHAGPVDPASTSGASNE